MADANLNCERVIAPVKGLPDQQITVGRHVTFQCNGSWDKLFNFNKAQIKVDEATNYTVKVIKAEARSVSGFDVDVVFYSAGEFQFTNFILSDGSTEILLGPQSIKVETVIEKPQEGKPPEPFGPIIPLGLSWPAYYLTATVGFILFIIALAIWFGRQRLKYIKLIHKLKMYDGPISADRQFYKAFRQAEAKDYPLSEIEYAFRLYITRAYQIPALDLSDRALLSFFKRRSPWLKKERLELKKILEDLKLLTKLPEAQLQAEKNNFIQKIYRFVDHAESIAASRVAR